MVFSEHTEVHLATLAKGPQKPISESRRFLLLVIGMLGCICCSFSYAFNLISGTLQKKYNLSQRDLSTISTVALVIQYFVIPYSFLYDFIGPIPIAILASVLFPLGALLLALCFQGIIVGTVVRLSVFNAMLGSGCALFDLVCVVTVLGHFPTNRGAVIALLKTFTGLGSAIVGCIYAAFFTKHVDWYFYFLMAFALAAGIPCVVLLRHPPYHLTQYEERRLSSEVKERRLATKTQYLKQKPPMVRFYIGFAVLIFLIVFLPTQGALVAYLNLGSAYTIPFAVVAIVATLAFGLVAAPLPCFGQGAKDKDNTLDNDASEPADGDQLKDGAPETEVDYMAPQYQETFLRNLTTPSLWALFWTLFAVVGTEFVIIFNASYLFGALSGEMPSASLRTLLTVLNGVGSAVGRLLMSYFESWSQHRKAEERIPITISLFFPTGSVIVTIVLFLVLPKAALPLPYVIAAFGNGFLAAVIILVTRTIYAQDPAKHYNFCFLASVFSSILLNRFLYGEWYSVQAEKQGRADKVCYGKVCVLMPLLVLLGLCCTAFLSDLYVHLVYVKFCRKVLEERRRLREGYAPSLLEDELCVNE